MQTRWLKQFFLVLAGGLLAQSLAFAQSDAVGRLTALLADVQTIEANFEQLTLDASGTRIQELQGRMQLKKPGKFVWVTEEPLPQELVSDGEKIWLYDPDLLQVTIQNMDERMSHTPALLLSGQADKISESFEVSYQSNERMIEFSLLPKDPDTLFDRLRLTFVNGELNDMHLEDAVGQKTSLYFFDLRMNQPLADDLFVFAVPDGVDVIEE